MKKVFNKNLILGLIIGLSFSIVSVYAATTYLASDVKYKDTTVENALDELYSLSNSYNCITKNIIGSVDSTTNIGQIIEDEFSPNMFFYFIDNLEMAYYNEEYDDSYFYARDISNGKQKKYAISDYYDLSNNSLRIHNSGSGGIGKNMYYVICK